MADPKVKFKRSSVSGKRPTVDNVELGEIALNTYDGRLYTLQDTGGIGIGTTTTLLTPWQESYGGSGISYTGDLNVTGVTTITGSFNVTSFSTFNGNIKLFDGKYLNLGNSNDLQVVHDGNNAVIQNSTGQIFFDNNSEGGDIFLRANDNVVIRVDGNDTVFTAQTGGIDVTGHIETDTLNVSGVSTFTGNTFFQSNVHLGDNDQLRLGDSNEFKLIHRSAGDSTITSSGAVYLGSTAKVNIASGYNTNFMARFTPAGSAELYYNYVKKFETTASGIDVTGHTETDTLNVSGISTFQGNVSFGSSITFGDNDQIIMGDGPDLKLYHDGSNSYVEDTGTGALIMKGSTIRFRSTTNENIISASQNGSVDLYHDNSKKFETTASGVIVTGIATVSGDLSVSDKIIHTGDTNTSIRFPSDDTITAETAGSERFRITSDGDVGIGENSPSSLLHVKKAGDPNVIQENSANDSLDRNNTYSFQYSDGEGAFVKATRPSGGAASATYLALGAGGSNERVRVSSAGDVGIGSDIPSEKLDVAGTIKTHDAVVTGVVTATTFVGALTGNVTGTATTATHAVQLQTARNIGGVSFNGTADINLPGVNATGNQDTSGNAATATALETARTIGGVSFDGTSNINLPGVNQAGNQNTSGTAAGLSGAPSITVTDITAVGNVSIAGTLTYEDVTSIDAIGIVTARTGVRVTTGGLIVSAGGANITGGITGDLTGDVTGNVTGNTSGSSGSCTGNSATATEATNFTVTANNSTNETVYPVFVDGATGTQGAETDTGLTYNPSTGNLTSTKFTGSGSSLTGLTGASAATYGSSEVTPVIAVDSNGRITGISTVATSGLGLVTKDVTKVTATGGQTVFNGTYSVGFVDVFLNGSKLDSTEFTATNGTSITLTTGATANDIIEIVGFTVSGSSGTSITQGDTSAQVVDSGSDGHFKVSTDGTERLRVTSAGKLGIGTDNPNRLLTLKSTTPIIGLTDYDSGGEFYIQNSSGSGILNADFFRILTNSSSEVVRISSTGLVGIGTDDPATMLDIRSSSNSTTDFLTLGADRNHSNTEVGISFKDRNVVVGLQTAARIHSLREGSAGDFSLVFSTSASSADATEKLRITSAGDMGLGTNSPTNVSNYVSFTLNGTTGGNIEFKDDGVLRGSVYNLADQFIVQAQGSTTPLAFRTNSTERLRIDSDGRLLLGTTTEGHGNADDLTISNSGNCGMTIRSGSSGSGVIYFSDATTGVEEYDGFIHYQQSTQFLSFGTDSTERMRIDSSGRLLLGTTTNQGDYLLQVKDGDISSTKLMGAGGGNAANMLRFRVHNTNNTAQSSTLGGISAETVAAWGGALTFSTKTANSTPDESVTERMRIDNFGRVGLGTDSPSSLLHLSGSGNQYATVTSTNSANAGILFGDSSNNDAGYVLYVNSVDSLLFGTGNATERMRINGSGYVAIGGNIITDSNLLNIQGSGATKNIGITLNDTNASQIYGISNGSSSLKFYDYTANAERMRIDSSGRLLTGTSSPRIDFFNQTWTPHFQFEGTSDQASSLSLTCNAANTQRPVLIFAKTRGATVGSDGLVANGDGLGLIAFMGNDGSENVPGAYIGADLDGTPGANDMPTRLRFSTTADGASSPTEQMRISSDGMVHIYTNDIKVRNITVGRGPGNIDTDTAVGQDALLNRTTGVQSVAVGRNALKASTTGGYNVAVGYNALDSATTGYSNTIVGAYSMATATTASLCCSFGTDSLNANTAWYNNAFGKDALRYNTTGYANAAFGYRTLRSNTTASANTAFGTEALDNNTTAWSNAAFGAYALKANTTGASNTAVGRNALYTQTTAASNTAVGRSSLYSNTTGVQNSSVGKDSLYDNTTGQNNNALGFRSLRKNTTGSENVAIGRDSGYFNTTGSGNISIGVVNSSGSYAPVFGLSTSNNRVVMGSTAVTNAYVQVAWTVVSDARDKMNFGTVPHGLEFIKQLNPVSFQFKFARDSDTPNGPVRYGFKAQDILALEGEDNAVIIDNDDPDKLRYNGEALVPVLVNAIKEQQTIIDTLIARLDAAGI